MFVYLFLTVRFQFHLVTQFGPLDYLAVTIDRSSTVRYRHMQFCMHLSNVLFLLFYFLFCTRVSLWSSKFINLHIWSVRPVNRCDLQHHVEVGVHLCYKSSCTDQHILFTTSSIYTVPISLTYTCGDTRPVVLIIQL